MSTASAVPDISSPQEEALGRDPSISTPPILPSQGAMSSETKPWVLPADTPSVEDDAPSQDSPTSKPGNLLRSLFPPSRLPSEYVKERCAGLIKAATFGDVRYIQVIAKKGPSWLRTGITKRGETVLHIAVANNQLQVVQAVIDIDPHSLLYTDNLCNTSFNLAAQMRRYDIAKTMLQHNKELPNYRGKLGRTPLHTACLSGDDKVATYLLKETDVKKLSKWASIQILRASIDNDLFDVAVHIVKNCSGMALLRDERGETALHALARKPLKKARYRPSIWDKLSGTFTTQGRESKVLLELTDTLCKQVTEHSQTDISALIQYPWRLIPVAIRLGKVEFLAILQHYHPFLIQEADEKGHSIYHIAVIHRQEAIFKQLINMGEVLEIEFASQIDVDKNNMLHLAGSLAAPDRLGVVPGAALQLQRELQWFEQVKKIMRGDFTDAENADKLTPQALFTKEHEDLRKQGEEWMKKTAESCALAAALIATMVFSAAFQLPGGTEEGSPILVNSAAFVFFAMSNAVSFFTATASILMFLSILTSRYAERDFLKSLPLKLMTGMILLLISITTMVIAFTVVFFMTFRVSMKWPTVVIAILASVPVLLFAWQQFPLLAEMYYSTYRHRSMFLHQQPTVYEKELKYEALYGLNPATCPRPTRQRNEDENFEFVNGVNNI